MKPIPETVKEWTLKHIGRMPETDEETDYYLDLINHAKEYADAFYKEQLIGKKMMKRLGMKTSEQVRKEFSNGTK